MDVLNPELMRLFESSGNTGEAFVAIGARSPSPVFLQTRQSPTFYQIVQNSNYPLPIFEGKLAEELDQYVDPPRLPYRGMEIPLFQIVGENNLNVGVWESTNPLQMEGFNFPCFILRFNGKALHFGEKSQYNIHQTDKIRHALTEHGASPVFALKHKDFIASIPTTLLIGLLGCFQIFRNELWVTRDPFTVRPQQVPCVSFEELMKKQNEENSKDTSEKLIIKCPLCRVLSAITLDKNRIYFSTGTPTCSVCQKQEVEIVLTCGHACLCQTCASTINQL
jgi:hypothetical protein